MALVFSPAKVSGVGERKDAGRTVTDITLDATSYSTGFAVTAANLRMQAIDSVNVTASNSATMAAGAAYIWDEVGSKIRAFLQGAGAGVLTEATAGVFSTSMVLRVEAIGTPLM